MQAKVKPMSLYDEDMDRLDAIVTYEKTVACNPSKVTRSSVLRELIDIKFRELKCKKLID